jgi:hypothetical protein
MADSILGLDDRPIEVRYLIAIETHPVERENAMVTLYVDHAMAHDEPNVTVSAQEGQ